MKRYALSFLVSLGMLLVVGCQTTTYQTSSKGTYELKRKLNAWQTLVNNPIEKAHAAVVAGLKDLKLNVITSQVDKISGVVDGVFADTSDFEVKLEAVSPELTRISIRCGVLGNRNRAEMLFQSIEKHF